MNKPPKHFWQILVAGIAIGISCPAIAIFITELFRLGWEQFFAAYGSFLGAIVGAVVAVIVAWRIISHERHEMRKDRVLPAAYAARGVLLELNERLNAYSRAIAAVGVIERHRSEDEASSQQFVQFRVNMLKNYFADIPFRDLSRSDQILLSMHTQSGLTSLEFIQNCHKQAEASLKSVLNDVGGKYYSFPDDADLHEISECARAAMDAIDGVRPELLRIEEVIRS